MKKNNDNFTNEDIELIKTLISEKIISISNGMEFRYDSKVSMEKIDTYNLILNKISSL